ncbi:MAG: tRNA uridine-5-carboxymethylaminomethyl(34) synthesis GTPase MnmE [Erysipelotrichaceae bacterium]|nr:tRNA uridine-5-carboxymethylaminomethyl(34) synthesis GTPase MnmE [Erysipelotrichaceae bacterium]
MLNDTIAAIATGRDLSAVSIIRISGDQAIDTINALFSKPLDQVESHTIHYGYIKNPLTKQTVDEVLVSVFRAPKTYTREDVVEINCHGGAYVTREVLSLVLSQGVRLAEPGEFTKRAFLNGRIDLTQAEAIQDLLEAKHEDHLHLAMNALKGSVHQLIDPLMEQLVQMISNIEVNIDYPEYDDVQVITHDILLPKTEEWLIKIQKILDKANQSSMIKEGIQTAIIGKPNVGKSSLLNALLEEDKAIVTDIAGTTRDIVEGDVRLQNITLHLMDTAGIRETKDVVEQLGIEKSKEVVKQAQLVILVLDNSQPLDEEDQQLLELTKDQNRILVYNKSDLGNMHEGITIRAKEGKIEPLIAEINRRYEEPHAVIDEPTLSNSRQIGLMRQAQLAMMKVKEALEMDVELDLVAIDLQECYRCLKEIEGSYSKEGLLDEIFSRFCLGK